jgi:hypothetical protein
MSLAFRITPVVPTTVRGRVGLFAFRASARYGERAADSGCKGKGDSERIELPPIALIRLKTAVVIPITKAGDSRPSFSMIRA